MAVAPQHCFAVAIFVLPADSATYGTPERTPSVTAATSFAYAYDTVELQAQLDEYVPVSEGMSWIEATFYTSLQVCSSEYSTHVESVRAPPHRARVARRAASVHLHAHLLCPFAAIRYGPPARPHPPLRGASCP